MHAKVYDAENASYAKQFLREAFQMYAVKPGQLVLHSDNGSSMKAAETMAVLDSFGVKASHSRPRVSNDNPYSGSLFLTLKYNGFFLYAHGGFDNIEKAERWLTDFVEFYNVKHLHLGINMVSPDDRYYGREEEILRRRRLIISQARKLMPSGWITGKIMKIEAAGTAFLNLEKPLSLAA